jgi:hypothetical protein
VTTRYIVITSIHLPSEAIKRFSEWPGWKVVVVGDMKTPKDWALPGVIYLDVEQQLKLFPKFSRHLPENTSVRKMVGYLYSIRHGADAILESDDDNIPYESACDRVNQLINSRTKALPALSASDGWLNVYATFGSPSCWPRGFPLARIRVPASRHARRAGEGKWSIMQYVVDDDPDVDAIYRLALGRPVRFKQREHFALAPGTWCPFNSQATVWLREAFPLMFLPLGVSDRVTDILRGYIAQRVLWHLGRAVGYASPVMHQVRNQHDLLRDFADELPLYIGVSDWVRWIDGASPSGNAVDACHAILAKLAATKQISATNLSAFESFVAEARLS